VPKKPSKRLNEIFSPAAVLEDRDSSPDAPVSRANLPLSNRASVDLVEAHRKYYDRAFEVQKPARKQVIEIFKSKLIEDSSENDRRKPAGSDNTTILSTDDVVTVVKRICEEFCLETGLIANIKVITLEEAYSAAMSSLNFHNIAIDQLSHYKILAHIGYWTHKFQPIHLTSPGTIKELVQQSMDIMQATIAGPTARLLDAPINDFKSELREYAKKSRNYATFPINEYVSWQFIYSEVKTLWDYLAKEHWSSTMRETMTPRLEEADNRFRRRMEDLVWSLRYHTYTPRTFATLVETLFRIDSAD
jgi:hypothetical protein